jgi:hypothetical protein
MNSSLWKFFTSLRMTVVCLALSILLVFVGTVAQADEGLYQAQERYFKQWFVWAPTLFGHQLPVLLPGGYLLGTVLLANLIAAHIKRFNWSWRKFGINLTHLGIIVLLVGQLLTDMLAKESHLRLVEGESRSYTESHREHELAVMSDTDANQEEVASIPEALVARKGEISRPQWPFVLRVKEYQVNGEVLETADVLQTAGRLTSALATVESQYATPEGLVTQAERAVETAGRAEVWRKALAAIGQPSSGDLVELAKKIAAQPELAARLQEELKTRFQTEMLAGFRQRPGATSYVAVQHLLKLPVTPETVPSSSTQGVGQKAFARPVAETKEMDRNNTPYAVVEVVESGKSLGTWLVSPWLVGPQEIEVAGKKWRVAFRSERTYLPFSVKLLTTTHEVYRGTDIPKNFQSRVQINNPVKGETREADIYMNNPLRYAGLTFFQYQMGKEERDANVGNSTLQVVRNPSWLTPYLGCVIVSLGMAFQFLFHLVGFLSKRRVA